MSGESGAPPEMKKRMRPPVRALSLAKTSRSASARWSRRAGDTGRRAMVASAHRSPTSRDQAKIRFRSGDAVRTLSSTLA